MTDSKTICVLFVNDHLGYAQGVWHGVTRYYLNVLPRLDPSKFSVSACFLRSRHRAADELEAGGIELTFLNRHRFDPRTLADLVRLVRSRRINVLHLSGMGAMLWGRLAARLTGCKAVVHFHEESLQPYWVAFAERSVARWTDWGVAVSDAVGVWCGKKFGVPVEKIETVPNGIPIEQFTVDRDHASRRIRHELGLSRDTRIICIIGRLSWEKGHRILLTAMRELGGESRCLMLLIIGEGPLLGELQALACDWGLEGCVQFLGSRRDIPELLAASDLCVIPSLNEGLPFVLLESLAAGAPVVASRVGGLAELLRHEQTALLVGPDDSSSLARAMDRMLKDRSLARSLAAGGRRCVEAFSVERHVERLQQIYETLVSVGVERDANRRSGRLQMREVPIR